MFQSPIKIELPVEQGFARLLECYAVELAHFLGVFGIPSFGAVHGTEHVAPGDVLPAYEDLDVALVVLFLFATFPQSLLYLFVLMRIISVVFQLGKPHQVPVAANAVTLKVTSSSPLLL